MKSFTIRFKQALATLASNPPLMPTMQITLQIDFWHLLAAIGTLLTGLFSCLRYFLKNLNLRFDALTKIDSDNAAQIADVKNRLLLFIAEMPNNYMRRDDFILHITRVEAKVDGLANKIDRYFQGERND